MPLNLRRPLTSPSFRPSPLWLTHPSCCAVDRTSSRRNEGSRLRTRGSDRCCRNTIRRFRFPASLEIKRSVREICFAKRAFSPVREQDCGGGFSILEELTQQQDKQEGRTQRRFYGIGGPSCARRKLVKTRSAFSVMPKRGATRF